MQTTQLSEDVGMYVDKLRADFAAVDQVWLIGARANGSSAAADPWELLTFADRKTLERLRKAQEWHRSDVNLLVVVDGERYEPAWGEADAGTLRDMDWHLEDPQSATYAAGAGGERLDAIRVR